MTATLHIIGSSPAAPHPGGANSCYLVRLGGATIVLDFGSGALSNLLEVEALENLDAIFISHMHADHFFDLIPLRYALKYSVKRDSQLPVYLPPGGIKTLQTVVSPFARTGAFFEGLMKVTEYAPDRALKLAAARISFAKTRHYVDAYAIRVEAGMRAIAFSADTAPEARVVELARDADLFLCESGLGTGTESGERGHSSAEEAAAMAKDAAARRLILTHYPAGVPRDELKAAAQRVFSGEVTIAQDGMEIALD